MSFWTDEDITTQKEDGVSFGPHVETNKLSDISNRTVEQILLFCENIYISSNKQFLWLAFEGLASLQNIEI